MSEKRERGRTEIHTAEGLRISIVPYSDDPRCGYIRFEADGKYLGALVDTGRHEVFLKKLRRAVDELLEGPRPKRARKECE